MVGGPGDADDEFTGVPCSELPMCHGLNPSVKRVNRSSTSRMANALYRLQTRLWSARNQSLFPKVTGARWMSMSQAPVSDIEVLSIFFFPYRPHGSHPNIVWKARGPQDTRAQEIACTGIFEIWSYLCTSNPCAL